MYESPGLCDHANRRLTWVSSRWSDAPECIQAAAGTSPTATEQVLVPSPAAGPWVVVVDPFDVPSGTTEFDYADVITSPTYGSVTVDDTAAFHPAHSTWSRTASATPLASAPHRPLGGFISVASGDSLRWGGARVELRVPSG